jgi:rubrerythrin
MPDFVNPFIGMTPDRKLSDRELARSLRLSLAAEEEAIHLYEALADATDNPLAAKGEFQQLLNLLLDDEQELMGHGVEEVNEMKEELEEG